LRWLKFWFLRTPIAAPLFNLITYPDSKFEEFEGIVAVVSVDLMELRALLTIRDWALNMITDLQLYKLVCLLFLALELFCRCSGCAHFQVKEHPKFDSPYAVAVQHTESNNGFIIPSHTSE
jgi:hypothetical protein